MPRRCPALDDPAAVGPAADGPAVGGPADNDAERWAATFERAAAAALAEFAAGRPVRLLGVRAEFADNPA